ncbi:zinc carboxypeptidase family protein [Stylonychia lemnae]|uniref:Zinc carboxypeptidase family protein n=1 Tax=Stylonychia lemnae TaxID=5949 RepID=A0A078A2D5_STYLE|nr:zinc carboxypeptidase family protein [Stylonychia lemnae]|eukprot:CDW76366.1 zinc carboxypeptidase family protein [Stylonychia lemnae]
MLMTSLSLFQYYPEEVLIKKNSDNIEKIDEDQDFLEEDSISNGDQELKPKKQNGQLAEKNNQKKKDKIKSSQEVQEKLQQYADQIKLQNHVNIDKGKYPNYFKYPIYDSYKPTNLCETRKLLQIYLRNSAAGIKNENLEREQFREFYNYSMNQMETKIPHFINQHTLLQFDSHFECGNLDSAYLVQENEYNLLMKVDTNTKGNSFWFYFKVNNGRPGQVVKFNILNFSRDLKHFYNQGMNICVLKEKDEKEQKWQQDKCFNIQFQQNPELIKSLGKHNQQAKYYHELTFKYKFEPADDAQLGNGIYFAYSIPFTYSQLISDLQQVKQNLMLLPHSLKKIGVDMGIKSSTESLAQELKIQGRQRLNQFELQHLEIRNQGLKLMKLNSLEKAILNEQNSVTDFDQNMLEIAKMNKKKNTSYYYKDEFEIKSGNLLYKQEIMAYSVGGLPIYQLTVTARCSQGQLKYKKRKVIYICARVHAGETNASYIMQNIIFEIANTQSGKYDQLLQNYIIKIIPMINVDGVSIGNGRASLVGLDLNRRWTNPNPLIHPEVFFLKKMLKKFNTQYEKGVQIFCDLHGHNRKLNSFVYGCHKAANSGLLSWTKTRLLPKILASITSLFNYRDCRFKIEKCKLNTARVVCWNELKITNSFTLEASLYGKQDSKQDDGFQEILQMTIKDYHDLGESFLNSISQYNNLEPELEQEFQQTNGWLKVSKLNDVTGKPAREKVQEENNLTVKKSQRLKKTLLQHQSNTQNAKIIEIRHRKSFIETAYNTSTKQQQTVVNQVATQNQQSMNRKQSFAISTTTASGNNQISAIKSQNKGGQKQSIKSAKAKMDKFQKRKTSSNKNMIRSGSSLNDDDSVSYSSKSTLLYQSSIGSNWRDFFEQKELDKAINLAQQNQILEEENEDSESDQDLGGSDSDPSEDNIDQTEFYEMISTVFQKEDQVSFDELLPQSSYNQDFIQIQDQKDNQKGFVRQTSQANLQLADDELDFQPLYQEEFPLQSPPYNFKRKNQDEYDKNDQFYDLQLKKQNQTNRIKHLQEQLEELERQKKQQLMLQQHLNQSQSSENQLNVQVAQYKNPVTSQASKTAYLGWNLTKNKMSSANLSQNSTSNFQEQKQFLILQKSPERIRNPPMKNPVLQHNGRLMSSNLFDPSKQKLITDQAIAQARQIAAQKRLEEEQLESSKEKLNSSSGFWQMRH